MNFTNEIGEGLISFG